jgi:hypothetical protein
VANEENRKLLATYWDKEYAARKISHEQAHNTLRWAIGALGQVSLLAPAADLQRLVDTKFRGRPEKTA